MLQYVLTNVIIGTLMVFCITASVASMLDGEESPALARFKSLSDKVFGPIRKLLPSANMPFDLAPLIVLLIVYTITRVLISKV